MGIFGDSQVKGYQIIFRDNRHFRLRELPIEGGNLTEKNNAGVVINAWQMRYKLQKRFDGYKNMPAGMYTLSYSRDIIFDPRNQLKENERPDKGDSLVKTFTKKIAEAKCYQHEQSAKGSLLMNKVIVFMGIVAILLSIALGLAAVYQ